MGKLHYIYEQNNIGIYTTKFRCLIIKIVVTCAEIETGELEIWIELTTLQQKNNVIKTRTLSIPCYFQVYMDTQNKKLTSQKCN